MALQLLTFWTLSILLFFASKISVSESAVCLRSEVKPYSVGPHSPYVGMLIGAVNYYILRDTVLKDVTPYTYVRFRGTFCLHS
jgi:hypothetical protein